jgi:AAA+ superfamily predicted ATPase
MTDMAEYRDKLSLSDLIRTSRAEEIAKISEALRENKNVLISGKFVTGKTTLSQQILELANEGKIWTGQSVKSAYAWTEHVLDGDEMTQEEIDAIAGSKPAVIVMDEVGHLLVNRKVDQKLFDRFIKQVRDFNEKGIMVIAAGWTTPELTNALSGLFPTVIDFQSPPRTMAEQDLNIYRDANRPDDSEGS